MINFVYLSIYLSIYICYCCCLLTKLYLTLFATPWTVAPQAPLSMGFPRQEYWSGLPFSFLGDLHDPRIESISSALQADSLPLSHQASSFNYLASQIINFIYIYKYVNMNLNIWVYTCINTYYLRIKWLKIAIYIKFPA